MFYLVYKKVFQKRGLLNVDSTRAATFLYWLQTPSLTTSIRPISTTNSIAEKSFTVSYLINSCGLSQAKALSASKLVQFDTSSRPDLVLTLLRNYGFNNTHIAKLFQRRPVLLLADPDRTLKPKLDFFRSIGFSNPDLANFLSSQSNIFSPSLEKRIIPSFNFLKSIVHTEANVIRMIKRSSVVLNSDPNTQIIPNMAVLQAHGVPDSNISKLFTSAPRTLLTRAARFKEIIQEINEMGFDPLKWVFVSAVQTLSSMSNRIWQVKLEAFKKWGWSNKEFQMAFGKNPACMKLSEKKITHNMDFFVNKMGYDPSVVADYPNLLLYSLEKRIIPRCSVLLALMSNGLVKKDCSLASLLVPSEKCFLDNYVTQFEEKVPELLKVYRGKVNILELPVLDRKESVAKIL